MKKVRVLFTVLAFTLAVAGAFAYSVSPKVIKTAWINTTPNPDVCTPVTVTCPGGSEVCVKLIPSINADRQIYQFNDDTLECDPVLSME